MSMVFKQFIIDQLLKKPMNGNSLMLEAHVDNPTREPNKKSRSISLKFSRNQQLLFLRIFKEVRKKLRKGNQYDVANEMKIIFKNAHESGIYNYISERKYYWEYDAISQSEVFINERDENYEEKIAIQNNKIEIFYKKIGLSGSIVNYLYGGYFIGLFDNLNLYISNTSPLAIVQMKKRLLRAKQANKI